MRKVELCAPKSGPPLDAELAIKIGYPRVMAAMAQRRTEFVLEDLLRLQMCWFSSVEGRLEIADGLTFIFEKFGRDMTLRKKL